MSRILVDVNAFAINLVDDHPAFDHVSETITGSMDTGAEVYVHGYTPFRAQYILTNDWDVDHVAARNAVQSALRQPFQLCSLERHTIFAAYEISAEKNHDVYDAVYVALARTIDADAILTTDRDFEALCADESFEYLNPVPRPVLERFHSFDE